MSCSTKGWPLIGWLEEHRVSSLGMYLPSQSCCWGLWLFRMAQGYSLPLGENERLVVDTQELPFSLRWSLAVPERLLHPDVLGHLLILF